MEGPAALNIIHSLVSREIGGAERYLIDLCRSLLQRGHRTSVLLPHDNFSFAMALREQGIPVTLLPLRNDVSPLVTLRVAAALRAQRADLLNIHDNGAAVPCCLGARLAGIPAVATIHAFHRKWAFLAATHMITVSEALRRDLMAQGMDGRRIRAVHSGINLAHFQPSNRLAACQALGLDPSLFFFATLGRLVPGKGLELLIDTFQRLAEQIPSVHLLIAGSGRIQTEIFQRAASTTVASRIHFLGFLPDVRQVYAAADCVVMPSEREGFGLTVLEAMACGRAVVATDSGGPAEIIRHDETGLLIPPNHPESLLEAMRFAMRHPGWCMNAGEAGRRLAVCTFSLEQQIEKIEAEYYRCLSLPAPQSTSILSPDPPSKVGTLGS